MSFCSYSTFCHTQAKNFVTELFYRAIWPIQTFYRAEYFISSSFVNIAMQWKPKQVISKVIPFVPIAEYGQSNTPADSKLVGVTFHIR